MSTQVAATGLAARSFTFAARSLLAVALTAAITAFAPQALAQGKVAMLLPGSINDQSWNANGYGALVTLKSKGTEIAYSENVPPADHIETMKDYARRGFSPVIGHSGRFLSAAQRVAPEFEKTTFIVGSGASGGGKNITSIDYDNAQMGYLMGVLAARMSKSGKVGSVNGLEGLPNVMQQVGGFRLGVKSVKPTAEVKVIYIKDMEDAAMAKEAALALISGGADFVFGKLNAGQNGIIQAAKEKNVFTSGRSFGHVEAAPQNVLTAVIEKWSEMYVAAANESRAGKLKPELTTYGFNAPSGSGAELLYAKDKSYNAAVPKEVIAELEAVKKKLASGELKVNVTKEDARGGV
jgi:simple sugar transport system substrate-binding protein/basic membrane protein A